MSQGILASCWALMAMVFVVASLGITNAVTTNVLEQTRELGIMRAVAMRRLQIGKMIVYQALAMGAAALVPGAALGLLIAVSHALTMYPLTGIIMDYTFEPVVIIGCLLAALGISVLAAVPPLRRVLQMSVVGALHYE